MLKKIFIAAFMLAAIVSFQLFDSSKASAQDVWVYTDRNSGIEYYVMTETFNRRAHNDYHFDVNVKYIRNGNFIGVKKYSFDGHAGIEYAVDDEYQGDLHTNEAAKNICQYCFKTFEFFAR